MIRALLVLLSLVLCAPAHAALTFFWRAEGTNLDCTAASMCTADFSAGDITATGNGASPEISATAVKIGTNGMLFNASGEQYRFDPTSIATPAAGAMAFWFQFPSAMTGAGNQYFLIGGSTANDLVAIEGGTGGDEVRLRIKRNAGAEVTLETDAASLAAGNFYFVVAAWDEVANDRYIAVYNSTGTQLDFAEDLATGYDQPTNFTNASGLRFGDISGVAFTMYADNVFIGSAYTDVADFVSNRDITTYANYSTGGGTTPLRRRRSN